MVLLAGSSACFHSVVRVAALLVLSMCAVAQAPIALSAQDQQIRERYAASLQQSPFQEQAFGRVYESYLANEGVDAWIAQLTSELETAETKFAATAVLGRIYQRQFKTKEAIAVLTDAAATAAAPPELHALLGTLYAEAARYDEAVNALGIARDGLNDAVQRGAVCRTLGNVYVRLGKRDEAIAAWKQLVELSPDDPFAYDELASIYEDNLMWAEAVGVHRALLEKLGGNPYLQCRTWHAIGRAHERAAQYSEAIVAYERALELAAPGNWLFEEAKDRLVNVYERTGNLDGLQQYLEAKVAAQPADVEFAHLLADTLTRRGKLEDAERSLTGIVERAPDRVSAYEDLLALYSRMETKEKLVATFEKLIALYPTEPDYLRRLGESHLLAGDPAAAKETWKRLIAADATPESHAMLADWYEQYEFRDAAIAAYEAALAARPEKEWVFRLAALKYEAGKTEDAVALWKSALNEQSTASDYAEVAALLAGRQQDDEAIALYKAAVEREPNGYEHRAALARLYMNKEAYPQALEQFTALEKQTENEYHKSLGERGMIDVYVVTGQLEAKSTEWQAQVAADAKAVAPRLRLARLYQRMGNPQDAIALYAQCAELEPDKPDHVRQLANAYTATRQTDKAIETYQKLIALDSSRMGQYYRELVQLYLSSNRKEEAVAAAERVAELSPDDPDVRVTLAQTYFAQERADDALQQYRNAVRLKPDASRYHAQYGDALSSVQRWGEAQDAYRKMLDVAQGDAERIEAVTRLANVYLRQERLPELVQEFKDRSRQTPKNIAAYQELAAIHRVSGNVAPLIELFETAAGVVDDKEAALRQLLSAAYDAGKLDKVVSTYEQLMAMSGKPTMNEWERLGAAYAQMGDLEKAEAAWDHISGDNPDDPAAYKLLARSFDTWGLADKAIGAREKAIELDPTDYALRVEHARILSYNDRIGDAMNELLTLLEASQLDDGTPAQPNSVQSQLQPSFQHRGGRPRMMSYPGMTSQRAPYGSLAYHRPEIINALVESARQTNTADAIVERLQKRMTEMPGNFRVRQDLLDIYTQLGKNEEAVTLAQSIVAEQPDNVDLRMQIAGLFQRLQRMEDAEREYRAVMERAPERKREINLMLVYLYKQFEKNDQALALAESIHQESPDDVQIVLTLAQFASEVGHDERARELYNRAAELDPPNTLEYRFRLANTQQERGNLDAAREAFEEILFAPAPAAPQGQVSRRFSQQSMYIPRKDNQGGRNNALMQLNTSQSDQIRIRIMEQLERTTLDTAQLAPLYERVRAEAEKWIVADTDEAKLAAWPFCLLHLNHLNNTEATQEALAFVKRMRERAPDDDALRQIALYAMHRAGDWDGMIELYAELEARTPSLAPSVLEAKMHIAMQRNKLEEALELFRQRVAQAPPQSRATHEIHMISEQLRNSNRMDLLIPFLEEQTSGSNPKTMFAQLLVNAYGERDAHDKAIELARRVWEASQRNTAAGVRGGRTTGHGSPGSNDPAFALLMSAYNRAGRGPELATEVEERAASQPGSLRLRECLIALYQQSNRTDEAIALYKELVALRPNSPQSKMEFAQFLANNNHAAEAIPIYEDLLKTQPSLYFSVSWQIRHAYEQAGRKQDLQSLDQKMADRATTVEQMEQLANQLVNDRSFDRAAELYERALRLDPARTHLRVALADMLQNAGKTDEAIRVYHDYIGASGASGGVDFNTATRIVDVYKGAERLPELVDEMNREASAKPSNRTAKTMIAMIAKSENRYDEALRLLEELNAGQPQSDVINQMVEILERQLNYDRAIELMETKLIPQSGGVDWNRLAMLYLKKGDRQKAYETWQREASSQNSRHAMSNVLRNLLRNALWPEAQEYYRMAAEKTAGDRDMLQQLNYALMEGAGSSPELSTFIETDVFALDFPGRYDMIRQYLYRVNRDARRARAILDPIRKAKPDDLELTKLCIEFLHDQLNAEELLPHFTALLASNPSEPYAVMQAARRLRDLGETETVVGPLTEWVLKQPDEMRVREMVSLFTQGNRQPIVSIFKLRDSFLERVPEPQRVVARIGFAELVAHHGDVPWAHDALRDAHAAKQFPLQRYIGFLVNWGYMDEAASLAPQRPEATKAQWNNEYVRFAIAAGNIDAAESAAKTVLTNSSGDGSLNIFQDYLGLHAMARRLEDELVPGAAPEVKLKFAAIYDEIDDHLRALRLTREVLDENPSHDEAFNYLLYRFDHLEQKDEKVAAMEKYALDPKNAGRPNDSRWQMVASTYLDAGRKDDARRILDAAVLTPDNGWQRMSRAALYIRLGEPTDMEKAKAEIDSAGQYARDPHQLSMLATALVDSGRIDEGMKLWRENSGMENAGQLGEALTKKEKYAETVEVLREYLKRHPDQTYLQHSLAVALVKGSTDDTAWRTEFEKSLAESTEQNRDEIVSAYARGLNESGAVERLASSPVLAEDDMLRSLVVRAIANEVYARKPGAAERLRALANAYPPTSVTELSDYAAAFWWLRETPSAMEFYRKVVAHPDAPRQKVASASWALINERDATAPQAILRNLEMGDTDALNGIEAIEAIGQKADPQTRQAILERMQTLDLPDAQSAFMRAYIDYCAGNLESAVPAIARLADNPGLSGVFATECVRVLDSEGRRDDAKRLCEHMAQGGYGRVQRDFALDMLTRWYAADGDAEKAIATLVRMTSFTRLQSHAAWRGICTGASVDAINAATASAIAADVHNDRVSEMLLLSADATRRAGQPFDMTAQCAALGVTGREADEALLLDRMIETWRLSPAVELTNGRESMKEILPESMKAALVPDAPLPQLNGDWTVIGPEQGAGLLWPDAILGIDQSQRGEKAAFAVTEITCQNEAAVTFSHAGDDYTIVWINGDEAFRSIHGRSAFPDQDRFTATLREGKNRVVVATGNGGADWGFALGMLDAPKGTTVTLPN